MLRRGVGIAVALAIAAAPAAVRAQDEVVVCAHAPITGSAPSARHPHRLGQVYADAVNAEQGGIDGRTIRFETYDDGSNPTGARSAFERCRREGADLVVGYGGLDEIAAVASIAASTGVPYLAGTFSGVGWPGSDCCAVLGGAVEAMAERVADEIIDTVPEARIGIIGVSSPYWRPGSRILEERLGERVIVERQVQKDETSFGDVWTELRTERADLVLLLLPAGTAGRFLDEQTTADDPQLVAFSPGLNRWFLADRARADAQLLVLSDEAPAWHRASDLDLEDAPPLAWDALIQEHDRIFQTYAIERRPAIDDVDWIAFIRARQIFRFLDSLDGGLSPAEVRAALGAYQEDAATAYPSCELRLGHDQPGTDGFHVIGIRDGQMLQTAACDLAMTLDLAAPTLTCTQTPLADHLRCEAADAGAGIDRLNLRTVAGVAGGIEATAPGGCANEHDATWSIPRGIRVLRATATDCSGRVTSVDIVHVAG